MKRSAVSRGCLDATLYELAGEVLADGRAQVVRFDSGSDDLFEPGLLCGGSMEVLVRRIDPGTDEAFGAALASLARGAAVTLALTVGSVHPERLGSTLVITGESVSGTLGAEEWDRECLRRRAAGDSGVLNMKNDSGERTSFFFTRSPRLPGCCCTGLWISHGRSHRSAHFWDIT